MANDEHLAILKKGSDTWNSWRRQMDLYDPEFGLLDLSRADLCNADLSKADLSDVNLSDADLSGANLDESILFEADLSRSNLKEAILTGGNLTRATFNEAYLFGADLSLAVLYQASLEGADLSFAYLTIANLHMADLSRANLTKANFSSANLASSNLTGATIDGTELGHTELTDLDLSPLVNGSVIHISQSSIDHRSIARSLQCVGLSDFLVAAGMPLVVAIYTMDAIRSLDPNGLFNLMYSTFISYGGPDEAFAAKLQEVLQSSGVATFLFKKDAIPGQVLSDVMRDQVRENDRVVVICSKNSLARPGVLNEMELALRREAREGGHTLLIPITIDDYVYDGWNPKNNNLREAVLERVIGDFLGADKNQTKFDQGVEKLLSALRVSR
jgi:uncharacterized protein YjbI with pentapeptide repeats